MSMNVKLALQLANNMGGRYVRYRVRHALEKKLGILKKKHPTEVGFKDFISLDDWRKLDLSFVDLNKDRDPSSELEEKAIKIFSGELLFFSSDWKQLGKEYNWISNPSNNYVYDISKHWSDIPDFVKETGDIKYVWEKSRFSFIQTIMRYDFHFGKNSAEFVFSEIESWIDANPVNKGPNWRCSQEISLRAFNWCFALDFYKNSKALTEERWHKIQNVLYWSLHHVFHHIDFSRIAVRNNHAITETLFLALSNSLFPFIPETKSWSEKGRRFFEREIDYQIYDDGTFLQFSMNYHRVVIQLLSFGISVSEKLGKPFSEIVYDKAYKSLNFLYQCLQEENGFLPNYGNNDGALFFPLSDTLYRDYRPQLNSLHRILTGKYLYQKATLKEDFIAVDHIRPVKKELQKEVGILAFDKGGYYLHRSADTFTFIRCGNHKDRPAQADNLHIDIWVKGVNIIRDSGSYKYNTGEENISYFHGGKSHNSVMVDGHAQMLKGMRFIWYYWTQCTTAKWKETPEAFIFEGEIKAFTQLNKNARHFRRVSIAKTSREWTIYDRVSGLDKLEKKQYWHFDEAMIEWKSTSEKECEEISYASSYYGKKAKGRGKSFSFLKDIETVIRYPKNKD